MIEHRCYIVRGGIPMIKSGLAVATRENGKENKAMRASPVSRVGMAEQGKWQREWLVRMPLDELAVIEAREVTKRK
jgi:hypothetical protein